MISCAACTIALARRASSKPSSRLTSAAARLTMRERRDQRPRHALVADAEIIARALGLRAPIAIGRDLDRPEAVGFGAGFHGGSIAFPGCGVARSGAPLIRDRRRLGVRRSGLQRITIVLRFARTWSSLLPKPIEPHDLAAAASAAPALMAVPARAGIGLGIRLGIWLCGFRRHDSHRRRFVRRSRRALGRPPRPRWFRTGSRIAPPDRRRPSSLRTAPPGARTPPNDNPTSNESSRTTRSQNWCCRTIVIASGYCMRMRSDSRTPGAAVLKVILK